MNFDSSSKRGSFSKASRQREAQSVSHLPLKPPISIFHFDLIEFLSTFHFLGQALAKVRHWFSFPLPILRLTTRKQNLYLAIARTQVDADKMNLFPKLDTKNFHRFFGQTDRNYCCKKKHLPNLILHPTVAAVSSNIS
ncbi:MAG TPA: hypothetical protein VFC85_07820 [Verrucomicrobiae bacterium]|nr:hypothetical protein [Verrucomicrobiae bacterium]